MQEYENTIDDHLWEYGGLLHLKIDKLNDFFNRIRKIIPHFGFNLPYLQHFGNQEKEQQENMINYLNILIKSIDEWLVPIEENYALYQNTQLSKKECECLKIIEDLIKKSIPPLITISDDSFGFQEKDEHIVSLGLNNQQLVSLPDEISRLNFLERLFLRKNSLKILPPSIDSLTTLKSLDLRENTLESLPDTIGDLQSLEILWMDNNQLTKLPNSMNRNKSLKDLCASENKINVFPEMICTLPNLERINLRKNVLENISESIGSLKKLKNLYVNDNPLNKVSGQELSILAEMRKNSVSIVIDPRFNQ
ncbi:MAG: hypothetical protein A2V66_16270 [Ignavibacteria bacterium RBG_13_36_8]|nr:MAG: hypothetical protein A2V66_16270 [Ignavibacteria bacterium RBG_13_36_8]